MGAGASAATLLAGLTSIVRTAATATTAASHVGDVAPTRTDSHVLLACVARSGAASTRVVSPRAAASARLDEAAAASMTAAAAIVAELSFPKRQVAGPPPRRSGDANQMPLKGVLPTLCRLGVLCISIYMSVRIRLFAVINYGRVIHEFDPWFNYRATEYMAANGWDRFQVCAAQSVLAHTTQCSLGA